VRSDAMDDAIREHPFEPFLNGRSEGTDLDLQSGGRSPASHSEAAALLDVESGARQHQRST
jgi:hypothetical protein